MSDYSSNFTTLSRSQRLVIGLIFLLAVDLIWVLSSELTEYIFKAEDYNKPFFSTYLKTSLFMLYLPGFCFYKPWRDQCTGFSPQGRRRRRRRRRYHLLDSSEDEDHNEEDEDENLDDDDDDETMSLTRSLSNPVFMPIKCDDKSESENEAPNNNNKKKIRFNHVAEVRQMSTADAIHANIARLSYHASLRAQAAVRRAANRLTVKEVAQLALMFCLLFFMGNYSYQAALSETEAGIVNVLSSTSCLFTLVLGAFFPSNVHSDKFTLSKLAAVCFSITGVVLVSLSDQRLEEADIPLGAFWALGGALFYSTYIVFLRRKVDHEDKLDIPMFFGFVGFFSAVLLWPAFFALHFSHEEKFQLPNAKQTMFLVLNGLFGTVVSELMWLMGCFLTSSLIATLAISLTIPLTMVMDIIFRKVDFGVLFYMGSLPMFLSFFLVTILTHYDDWDPLLDLFKWVFKSLRGLCFPAANNSYVFDRQERESLINQESSQQQTTQTQTEQEKSEA